MSAGAPKKPADGLDREKNEYIPSFITKKPFWVPEDDDRPITDYLEHQRLSRKDEEQQQKWYDRGKRAGPAATKYRKGACENCGSMTHKTKECLSRRRTKGAKWTGKNIAQDEVIDDVKLGWDAKRDRWNGYDAAEYNNVVRDYEELDRLKHESKPADEKPKEEDEADNDDEARYAEESDMGRQQSTATRNLRMREDTAKYLLNLDPDSAKYDPKSRSMMDGNPDPGATLDADDGFMRPASDAAEFEKAQKFAWETQERGDSNRIHIQANPTSADYIRRKLKEESDAKRVAHQKQLVDKYGAQTDVSKASALRQTAVTENEVFVEYDKYGTVKTQGKASTKSKYAEDVYINNHTSVWGSYWKDFTWGYACCQSFVKNSYCVGMTAPDADTAIEASAEEEAVGNQQIKDNSSASVPPVKAKKRAAAAIDGAFEEEMEAYKKARGSGDDPMKSFLGRDEIVH